MDLQKPRLQSRRGRASCPRRPVRACGWLVRSGNGGRSWTRLFNAVRILVVDPRNPRTLYGASPTAILRSTDGGLTWKRASAGLPDLYSSFVQELLADPAFPGRFYAVLGRGALYEATFPGL